MNILIIHWKIPIKFYLSWSTANQQCYIFMALRNIWRRRAQELWYKVYFENNIRSLKNIKIIFLAYLKRNDHNVIGVDYGKVANDSYPLVARNAFNVGTTIVETLNKLVTLGFDPEKFHIVGHSMGAQIAGNIGRRVSFKIPRITGKYPKTFVLILLEIIKFSDILLIDTNWR